MAHRRKSRPDSGLGCQVNVLECVQGVPSSLGRGGSGARAGLYLLKADVTVWSHSSHPTRGCIPRGGVDRPWPWRPSVPETIPAAPDAPTAKTTAPFERTRLKLSPTFP